MSNIDKTKIDNTADFGGFKSINGDSPAKTTYKQRKYVVKAPKSYVI